MVAISKICIGVTAAVGALAAPSTPQHGPLVTFQQLKQLPSQWTAQGQADKGTMIKAQIGLKQSNVKGLQEKLMDISNPSSANYGKWLSQEEIASYTAPSVGHAEAVKAWLAAAGITQVSQPSSDWIEFTVPVHQLESLLDAKYEWFSHGKTGTKVPRTTKYSVPQALHSMIDLVTPTTAFYSSMEPHAQTTPNTETQSIDARAACTGSSITPACINSLYNVDYTSAGGVTVASTGLLGIGANHTDYAQFGRTYVSGLKDFKDISINGGVNNGDGSKLEGNLDTQYVGGVSYPNPSQYLALGPAGADATSFNDALASLTNYLNTNSNPPSSVSTSYGGEEQGFDGSYMDRICNEFMKAGSRGISVFFSSGDHGVGGNGEPNCDQGFYATWPASCPWITTVGGTEFKNGTESVANFYNLNTNVESPGGGYSWHFAAPDYNKNATAAYANSLDSSYQGYFDPNGRGYPDISLVSVGYQTIVGGKTLGALGTSASSPAWAALVSVLNDYRRSKGKANLGFINPLLYSTQGKAALRDVTSGNNFGCGTNGYYAAKGWDAASGLGTLDFAKLRAII